MGTALHVRLPLAVRPCAMSLQAAPQRGSLSRRISTAAVSAGSSPAASAAAAQSRWRRPGLTAGAVAGPLGLPPLLRRQRQQQQPLQQAVRQATSLPSPARRSTVVTRAYGAAADPLVNLGSDFLTFLVATVLVVPVFKSAKQSPVLGYLFAGLVLGQLGLFRNLEEVEKLSELGVLFLLFEMGLELSIDRLRALASFAFGMGTLQMLICTVAFTLAGLPAGHSLLGQFLEGVLHAPASLAELRTVDEAVVIGAALSLSSSAFVLQLLRERGELDSRFGQATLGILLLQDIATVPFLVLLPVVEGSNAALLEGQDTMSLLQQLGPTALETLGGLAVVLLGGRFLMRRVFELVAEARSEETFIALCLLSVTGASLLTQRLGFSDTLGAFVAGVLLSETNFKTQVEADIQPFRGILLGLFFVTTGSSLDVGLLVQQWPLVLTLLSGLLALKISIIAALGPLFGLSKQESIRTGFLLSQGGEFAFVLLALANQLNVLPAELNRLLIIVVVLSMALTPLLAEVGKQVAKRIGAPDSGALYSSEGYNQEEPVLICGFGDVGQTVANMLESPALGRPIPYTAFDLTVGRVQAAQEAGFNVLYGDGSKIKVLRAAGIERPKAIVVAHTARQRSMNAVESLHEAFPDVPVYVRALDMRHAAQLQEAGATHVVTAETEAGLTVGSRLAKNLGVPGRAVATLASVLRSEMGARSAELAEQLQHGSSGGGNSSATGGGGGDSQAVMVFKFDQSKAPAFTDDPIKPDTVDAVLVSAAVGAGAAAGTGLLSTIMSTFESVGGSAGGSADGEEGSGSSGSNGSSGELDAVDVMSVLDLGSESGGDEAALPGECYEVPDGSVVCPVPWEGAASQAADSASAEQQAAAAAEMRQQ